MTKLDHRDEGRTGATHTIEQAHHFRHGGHLYFFGSQCSYNGTNDKGGEDPGIVMKLFTADIILIKKYGTEYRQGHAYSGDEVTPSRRFGMRQHFQTDNECDGSKEIDKR